MMDRTITKRLMALVVSAILVLTTVFNSVTVYADNGETGIAQQQEKEEDGASADLSDEISDETTATASNAQRDQENTGSDDIVSDDMTDEELSELVGELTEEELYELSDEGKLTKKVINGIGDVQQEETIDVGQYIDFTCIVDDEDDKTHTDLKDYVMNDLDITSLEPGFLENTAPDMFECNGYNHLYHRAVVGNTPVYYAGILDVGGEEYVYYTTSQENSDRTVYSVLKDGEQIDLMYVHKNAYKIEYKLVDQSDHASADTALTEDDVFGDERTEAVEAGGSYLVHVKIPRGYTATVEVTDEDGNQVTTTGSNKDLGKMMAYKKDPENKKNVVFEDGSPKSMILNGTYQIDDVEENQTVTVCYEKHETFKFSAQAWSKTVYASGRLKNQNNQNMEGDITDHTYTWIFNGETSSGATWEMDQLNFNGEAVEVPMVNIENKGMNVESETTLSTGTVVKIKVTSNGGINGRNGTSRTYKVMISNCYENITVSGGNMVGHAHKEIAVRRLSGVTAEYKNVQSGWTELKPDGLIGRKDGNDGIINSKNNKIRFTTNEGYGKPVVRLLSKDAETTLQQNGDDNNYQYIRYIYYSKEGADAEEQTYDSWTPSCDGSYYLKTTDELVTYMNKSDSQGVILLEIEGTPTKVGVSYISGGDQKDENGKMISPASGNIINMPEFDKGGEKGYNIQDNEHVPISSVIPKDLSGNFEFDHWQLLTVDPDGTLKEPKADANYITGQSAHLTTDSFDDLSDCYYWNESQDRMVFTMQAVWKSENVETPINYDVYCYLDDQKIYTETHTANKGAVVLVDAWKSGTRTFSDAVNKVLKGTNNSGKDYTQNGTRRYLIDEARSTMKIDNLQPDNNILYVYFVTADTQLQIQKQWVFSAATGQKEAPVDRIKVQLQRKTDGSDWKNVDGSAGGVITLSKTAGWKAETGSLPLYQDDDLTKPYTYRVLEKDGKGETVKEGEIADFGPDAGSSGSERTFLVDYQKQEDTWTILNAETPTGALKVSNTVGGEQGDQTAEWTFTVKQDAGKDDTPLTGSYGGMEFKNGTATFKLKHGESIIAAGIPAGNKFTVTEADANKNGYISECNGTPLTGEGSTTFTIESNKTVTAAFYNSKDLSKATAFLKALKYVNGSIPSNDQKYTFYLKDDSGRMIQKVQNVNDQINFNKLEFSKAGTYTYYLMEADERDPHVQYSQLVYEADVTVTEKEDVHQLEAQVVYKNTGSDEVKAIPEFHNQVTDAAYIWVSVMKQWKDDKNIHRPESVTVQLYKDQQPYGEAKILSSEDDWTYTWTGLDRNADWTVGEVDVPDGYEASVTHDGNNWVITNTGKSSGDNGNNENNGNNGNSSDSGTSNKGHEGGSGGHSSSADIAYTADASDGPGQQKGTTPSSTPGKTDPAGNPNDSAAAVVPPDIFTIEHSRTPGAGADAPSEKGHSETGLPKTGEPAKNALWPVLMVISLACMVVLMLRKKKR